ncbi:MAG: ISL3 family transposase [Verrucomicrobia subdivision 3 bacterium]|nr:ISL3 family transposase [Limisphaerales bacterium]
MTAEKLFHELLGLGLNWEVVESRFDQQSGTVFLEIRETARLWESIRCPQDTSLVFCYDHTEVLTWRHLNVFQHRCEVTCRLPRGKCRSCGHVFGVRPPWEGLSMHFTKEFEAFALLLMREMPMSKVAELVGETDTRLWRMLFRQVDAAYAEADFSNVCCVGVDELSICKGHDYVSVFADLVRKRVLFATEGKEHAVWLQFVEALEKHNGHRHAITQASMDMSPAYQKGVQETCRNAQVVFDKFHVILNVNKAVDQVRRAEVRLGGAGVWEALHKSQWLWRKNPENLTEQEAARLAGIDQKSLRTAKAYQMRLVLQDTYKSPTAGVARQRFRVWCRWVRWVASKQPKNLLRSMVKVAEMVEMVEMVEKHLAGILAHRKWGVTNAFMEGLNSVFSATKRKARGYRSTTNLITMLYFTAGKLRFPQF